MRYLNQLVRIGPDIVQLMMPVCPVISQAKTNPPAIKTSAVPVVPSKKPNPFSIVSK